MDYIYESLCKLFIDNCFDDYSSKFIIQYFMKKRYFVIAYYLASTLSLPFALWSKKFLFYEKLYSSLSVKRRKVNCLLSQNLIVPKLKTVELCKCGCIPDFLPLYWLDCHHAKHSAYIPDIGTYLHETWSHRIGELCIKAFMDDPNLISYKPGRIPLKAVNFVGVTPDLLLIKNDNDVLNSLEVLFYSDEDKNTDLISYDVGYVELKTVYNGGKLLTEDHLHEVILMTNRGESEKAKTKALALFDRALNSQTWVKRDSDKVELMTRRSSHLITGEIFRKYSESFVDMKKLENFVPLNTRLKYKDLLFPCNGILYALNPNKTLIATFKIKPNELPYTLCINSDYFNQVMCEYLVVKQLCKKNVCVHSLFAIGIIGECIDSVDSRKRHYLPLIYIYEQRFSPLALESFTRALKSKLIHK